MVTAIIILKMLAMPLLGGAAVLSLRQWVTDDPMLLFVLILLAASPTGKYNTIVSISNYQGL
jgi:predicted permease